MRWRRTPSPLVSDVLAELERRLPGCDITSRTRADEQRDVESWLKFFGRT